MQKLCLFSITDSEEKELALLSLLICGDGKQRQNRKRKYWVKNFFRKRNKHGAFSKLVNEMRLGGREYYFK